MKRPMMKRMLPSVWRCCCVSFWRTGENLQRKRTVFKNVPFIFVCGCGCDDDDLRVPRDRVSCVWQTVRDHLYHLCVHANESCFLVERAVVGLLRLAIRLLRREDVSSQVGLRLYPVVQKQLAQS